MKKFRVYDPVTNALRGVVPAKSKEEAARAVGARRGMTGQTLYLFGKTATVKMQKALVKP